MNYLKMLNKLKIARKPVNCQFFPKETHGIDFSKSKVIKTPHFNLRYKYLNKNDYKNENLESEKINLYLMTSRDKRAKKSVMVNSNRDLFINIIEIFGIKNIYYEFYINKLCIIPNQNEDLIREIIFYLKINKLISNPGNFLYSDIVDQIRNLKPDLILNKNLSEEEYFCFFYFKSKENKFLREFYYNHVLEVINFINKNEDVFKAICEEEIDKKFLKIKLKRFLKKFYVDDCLFKNFFSSVNWRTGIKYEYILDYFINFEKIYLKYWSSK